MKSRYRKQRTRTRVVFLHKSKQLALKNYISNILIDVGDKIYSLRERMSNEERFHFLAFILRPVCKGKHEILGRNDV